MAPLRILHVTPYYEEAWAYGGIPRVVAAQARALAARGHQLTIATTDACDGRRRLGRPAARNGGPAVRVFPNVSNRLAYGLQLFLPRGMDRWLRAEAGAFDVAHVHGMHHVPGALAARHLAHAGVPWILQPNGTAPRLERRRLAKLGFDATVGRGVLEGATRLLAVSAAERRAIVALGVAPERIEVLGNPLDLDEFEALPEGGELRQRLGLDPRTPIVLYLGTLTPRKNIDVLVAALPLLGHRPEPFLAIAGNDLGAGRRVRRAVAERGVGARVAMMGLLRGRDRIIALRGADAVVYPSENEAFGLVPLEALLCGTPVIVCDDAGCGEVVAALGGASVPPRRADSLARELDRLLRAGPSARADAARMGGSVRQRFGAMAIAARLESVYERLVEDGR